MNNAYKCAIAVPCNGAIEPATDAGLRELEKRGFHVHRVYGYSAIDQARCRITYDLIYREKYGAMMWIDSDIDFNPDYVEKFTHMNLPIVGGAYPMKSWPLMTFHPLNNKPVTFSDSASPVEVECLATGFLYVKAEVYHTLERKLKLPTCNVSFNSPHIPFYQPGIFEDIGGMELPNTYLGEDFSFSKRCRQCGFKVMLDPSVKLGHIGKYTYTIEDIHNQTGLAEKPNTGKALVYTHNIAGGSNSCAGSASFQMKPIG